MFSFFKFKSKSQDLYPYEIELPINIFLDNVGNKISTSKTWYGKITVKYEVNKICDWMKSNDIDFLITKQSVGSNLVILKFKKETDITLFKLKWL